MTVEVRKASGTTRLGKVVRVEMGTTGFDYRAPSRASRAATRPPDYVFVISRPQLLLVDTRRHACRTRGRPRVL